MDTLDRDDFAKHLNTNFNVYFMPDAPTEAELIQVTEVMENRRQRAFALLFQGPPDPIYDQRLFRIEHPELGTGALFLVPVAQVEKGIQYEAVFNRATEE